MIKPKPEGMRLLERIQVKGRDFTYTKLSNTYNEPLVEFSHETH